MTHQFNSSIFREYDIRGTIGKNLNAEDAYYIGRAYATMVKKGRVCIGYDGRVSSPELSDALIRGLTDSGIDVVNIGLVPTPITYFGVFHLDLDGGIMVTGSHNPPDQNGFKIMLGKESLHGDDIRKLSTITDYQSGKGNVENIDLKPAYIERIYSALKTVPKARIGWDAGNGAAGEMSAVLAEKLGSREFVINEVIDGTFPSHHPDPTVEKNLEQLKDLVLKNNLDVGFAFDGDGDRLGVIDNKGRPIWGDQILAILASEVLKKLPGAPIVVDVKTSQAVCDYIAKCGGEPVIWKTGHSLVKAKMKELDSPLAGEMSAHIFIKDEYYGYDDGLYAAVRFLRVMQNTGKTAAELLDELPKMHSTPELRFEVDEVRKFAIVDEVKASVKNDAGNYSDIDGVRVSTDGGWWLLRASNTGNQLVARAEGKSEKEKEALVASLRSYLANSNVSF